jgi:galactokinase
MGGGFGVCTINLVENDHLDDFKEEIKRKYLNKYNIDPDVIEVENSEGVRVF